jgi:hypothetical protein
VKSSMTKRDDRYNERLAYHEGGSLVAYKVGFVVDRTTIERSLKTGAEGETIAIHPKGNIITSILRRFELPSEMDDEDQIAYRMAGVEAVRISGCETISTEGSPLSDDIIEARSDIIEAISIAKRMSGGRMFDQYFAFGSGKSKAAVILEENADALNAIARALVESTTLSGIEIAKIIETYPPAKRNRIDRIPVNAVCAVGPCAVFDTNDDVALYEMEIISGDWLAANSRSRVWLREAVNVKVLYHGPYQEYVAPDSPQSTLDALRQFESCQIQILGGPHKSRVGWVVDTKLRWPSQNAR